MSTCRSCGQELGAGRYCPHCGTPVDPTWRTDTAERPAVRSDRPDRPDRPAPRTPPSAVAPPPPPRYPLFADEVTGWTDTGSLVTRDGEQPDEPAPVAPEPSPALDDWFDAPAPTYQEPQWAEPERRSPWRWLLVTVLVLALVAGAWWFVVRDTGGSDRGSDGSSASPSADGGGELVDVARDARARAPEAAPPNEDVNGERTTYDAANMVDGDPTTTWRTAGDATGTQLRFVLPQAVEIHQVGLVNGYAKTATDDQGATLDWYAGNRRVLEVVWVLPGGQQVRQSLDDGDRELQVTDVDPVEADKVVLRITRVSAPGEGPAARDFTAISEVELLGPPAS